MAVSIKEALKSVTDQVSLIVKSIKALEEQKTDDENVKKNITKVLTSLTEPLNDINTNLKKAIKATKDDDAKEIENIVESIEYESNKNQYEPISRTDYYAGPNHYLYLSQRGKAQATYVWIGGSGLDLRAKTKTLPSAPTKLSDLPKWNYDGSSTGQAEGRYSEVWLNPVKMIPDPFRRGNNVIVMCETLDAKTMKPLPTNKRGPAMKIFGNKKVLDEKPWYGIEQEYTMFDADGKTPLGWPKNGFPAPQGPYYCSVGAGKAFGRKVVEAHYRTCLYAGINISGSNAEVMAGQWEFQIGPCEGIDSGDSLWLARYLLERVAEEFNVVISFDVKPIPGDWNGAGCHTNYSTKSMRGKGGMAKILQGIHKMEQRHAEHMAVYGKGNNKRLTGKHETQSYKTFSFGVADRGASIRIPRQCDMDGKGYFEDRRPGANMDPYEVTSLIAETTIIYELKKVDDKSIKKDVYIPQ